MPSEIASWPAAVSTRTFGRKFGEPRSAPRSRSTSACSTIPGRPPIAEPKMMPTRLGSKPFMFASVIASRAAPSASRTLRSSLRASFADATWVASKSLTSAATRTGKSLASKALIQSIPLSPATAVRHVDGASSPRGEIVPTPVTATLLTSLAYVRAARRSAQVDSVPSDGGRARPRAARRRPLAVRAKVGRVPRRARERGQGAFALVAQRPAAAPLLPGAAAARRASAAEERAGRRGRDRARRRNRLRLDADAPAPGRIADPQALGRDPRRVRRLRRPVVGWGAGLAAAARRAAARARARCRRLPALTHRDRPRRGAGVARPVRVARPRRRRRQAARLALPAGVA